MLYHVRHLELLYWIYASKGMGPAAEKLDLAGSTVSEQIQEFEAFTGPLFNRKPFRELPEGRRIFEAIKPMFEWREEEHRRHQQPGAGVLSLGAPPIVLGDYIAPLMPRLRRELGDTQLILEGAAEAELRERLAHGQLDLVIGPGVGAPVDGEHAVLLRCPLALLVARESLIRTGARWWLRLHPRERLICPGPDTAIGNAFQSHLAREHLQIPVAVATDTTSAIAAMVLAGGAVGVVLDVPGSPPPKNLRRVPLPDAGDIAICAAWRLPTRSPVEQLLKIFFARGGELVAGKGRTPQGPTPTRRRRAVTGDNGP